MALRGKIITGISVLAALALVAGVLQSTAAIMPKTRAIAVLHPTDGNQVSGTVSFVKTMDGVQITADLSGLSAGKHGFHIHQWGDCSAPDGTSAGRHYDPFSKPHGGPGDKERHVGDLGNIEAGADGKAHLERVDRFISLEEPHSIVGRAVIVHSGEDDLKSQPTGDAGGRLACGVIGYDE